MKRALVYGLLVGLCSLGANAQVFPNRISSETGNHCVDQAFGHLRFLFGPEISLRRIHTDSCPGCSSQIWIRSNLCDGFFVAAFNGTSSCGVAHYGRVPQYVSRVWAHGDCARLLPADSYPTFETTVPFQK